MTSNVGAQLITENRGTIGFGGFGGDSDNGDIRERVTDELKKTFKPEFLNRVDDTIVFGKLSAAHIEEICRLLLADVASRADALGITLTFSEEAVSELARRGFDKAYGARPLRRLITAEIENMLSVKLLNNEINGEVQIDYDEEFICTKYQSKRS
jgi:ATP-dependent Clp protease ATP-binding subunit ClpC